MFIIFCSTPKQTVIRKGKHWVKIGSRSEFYCYYHSVVQKLLSSFVDVSACWQKLFSTFHEQLVVCPPPDTMYLYKDFIHVPKIWTSWIKQMEDLQSTRGNLEKVFMSFLKSKKIKCPLGLRMTKKMKKFWNPSKKVNIIIDTMGGTIKTTKITKDKKIWKMLVKNLIIIIITIVVIITIPTLSCIITEPYQRGSNWNLGCARECWHSERLSQSRNA